MEQYLETTLSTLKSNCYSSINLVLGNESCDLDSSVCALVYACFLNWQHSRLRDNVCTKKYRSDEDSCGDTIYVPVINVTEEDYDLKTEVIYSFTEHGINASSLIFRNTLNLLQLSEAKKTTIVLVDHHVMAEQDRFLAPFVAEIIDHRPKDMSRWNYREDVRSTIDVVGSCCTLVCNKMRSKDDNELFFEHFPECAHLLYYTIILDTANFSKDVKKGTPVDEEVVVYLETLLEVDDPLIYREQTLSRLGAARRDVSALTAAQLLRKDVKFANGVFVPSFPIPVRKFLERPNAQAAMDEALKQHNCSIMLLLGMDLSQDSVTRDLAVYSMDEHVDAAAEVATLLEAWSAPSLQLSESETDMPNCQYFQQNNLSASRKQVMPVVAEFLIKKGK